MISKKQHIIQTIIHQSYYQCKKGLLLCTYGLQLWHRRLWADVLVFRDWTNINILTLGCCSITDRDVQLLLQLDWPQLTQLELDGNQITSHGVSHIVNKKWSKLHTLQLFDNSQIGDEGLLTCLQNSTNNKFSLLNLSMCGITVKGINLLVDYCVSSHVKILDLSQNIIGSHGIKLLTKLNMPNLQKLSIGNCGASSEGYRNLSKAKWSNLKQLSLFGWVTNSRDKLMLYGLQFTHHNVWVKIQRVEMMVQDPICWMSWVLIQGCILKFYRWDIQIENQQLHNTIQQILEDRHLIHNN